MDGDGLLLLHILSGGHEEHILVLQHDIGCGASHDAGQVHGNHLQCAVLLHAVHHGMGGESLLGDALTIVHQGLHTGNLLAQLIHAWTEHGTLHLHHVLIAVQHGIHEDRVAVGHLKGGHIKLIYVEHRHLRAQLTNHAYRLAIGIAGKVAGIVDEALHALVALHLIVHRALHLTVGTHQTVVRAHRNHVIVLQAHITFQVAVEDIVIHIDRGDQSVVAIHLDVTQRT